MNPQDRKTQSEARLRALGIPVNLHLPMIETDDEVTLRTVDEVLQRLVALWAVVDKAFMGAASETAAYITAHGLESWLSGQEREYLFNPLPSERDGIHFSWQLEALHFVAWCAGLLEAAELPVDQSSVKPMLPLLPSGAEPPERLRAAIRLRSKTEVLNRADLLYRLHWAVRNAQLNQTEAPQGIDGGVVREWHRAVNWMTGYDGQDDWDQVGTDT